MIGTPDYSGSDASTVIQNAINALPAAGGKLHFKAAVYTLTTLITVPLPPAVQGFVMEGEGGGYNIDYTKHPANTIFYCATDIQAFQFNGTGTGGLRASGLQLRDFLVEGPYTLPANPNTSTSSTNDGINVLDADSVIIERVFVRQFNRGIVLNNCDAPTITNCNVQNTNIGIQTLGNCNFGAIRDNLLSDNFTNDMYLFQLAESKVNGNQCFGNGKATINMLCQKTAKCTFVGNNFRGAQQSAINIYGGVAVGFANTIAGNYFGPLTTTTGPAGALKSAMVDLGPSSDNVIIGNVMLDDAGSPKTEYAVLEDTIASTSNNIVIGNRVKGIVQTIAISLGATGSYAFGNLGFNPQAVPGTVTAGASPYTDPAQAYPYLFELEALNGGTAITLDAVTMPTTAHIPILVNPGHTLILTWAATAPTYKRIPQ